MKSKFVLSLLVLSLTASTSVVATDSAPERLKNCRVPATELQPADTCDTDTKPIATNSNNKREWWRKLSERPEHRP